MAKRRKSKPKNVHVNRHENAPRGPKPAHKKRGGRPQPKAEETSSRPAPPSRSKGGGWRAYQAWNQNILNDAAGGHKQWELLDAVSQRRLSVKHQVDLVNDHGRIWHYWE